MNRVVVTGMGIVSPIGIGIDDFFHALVRGDNGVAEITAFDCPDRKYNRGGEVDQFNPKDFFTEDEQQRLGKTSQLAIAAAKEAVENSGFLQQKDAGEKIGVSVGTTMGEAPTLTELNSIWIEKGAENVPSPLFYKYQCGQIACNLSEYYGLQGPACAIPTACASGNYAIGYAYDLIRRGKTDAMIAGGADSISPVSHTGFQRLKSLTDDCVRPFDKNRKGIITGEGSAMMLLESYQSARKRGATIHAEILGYGLGCAAYHMTVPHPEGSGAQNAMKMALKNSRINCEQIDYVSAHGTGTPANDKAETIALKSVFGSRAFSLKISSIKSMMGHTMGAASAMEAVSCVLAIENDVIPPTINYEEKDPDCDLDYVPNHARASRVDYAMSNAYAFGGNDSSLIIGRI